MGKKLQRLRGKVTISDIYSNILKNITVQDPNFELRHQTLNENIYIYIHNQLVVF